MIRDAPSVAELAHDATLEALVVFGPQAEHAHRERGAGARPAIVGGTYSDFVLLNRNGPNPSADRVALRCAPPCTCGTIVR